MTVDEQMEILQRHSAEIISSDELRSRIIDSIRSGRPLRVKQGIDPTTPDVHLGHMVPYRLMRAFQDCGHQAVLIIGDITAQIGDPTGRDSERQALNAETVNQHAQGYVEKILRVVDDAHAEFHRQSDWYNEMALPDVIRLLSSFSVAEMLSHETFRARIEAGARLSLHELVYPTLQALDSVHIEADVEIGGSDQKFNMLCGRDLQRRNGQPPQCVLTTPLLPGTDGRKMSKSFGNHIPVDAEADQMYGKVMSLPDELMPTFYRLASGLDESSVQQALHELSLGALHPREAKARLAGAVVESYHGPLAAAEAAESFDRIFQERGVPDEIPEITVEDPEAPLARVLWTAGVCKSVSDARRLILQGAVRLDGVKLLDPDLAASRIPDSSAGRNLRIGKRRFLRVIVG